MTGQHAVGAPESSLIRIATAAVWTLVFAAVVPAVIVFAILVGILWMVARGMTITDHAPRGRHDGHADPLDESIDGMSGD